MVRTFDHEYYRTKHVPLCADTWKPARVEIDRGVDGPYVAAVHFLFDSADAFQAALASEGTAAITADVAELHPDSAGHADQRDILSCRRVTAPRMLELLRGLPSMRSAGIDADRRPTKSDGLTDRVPLVEEVHDHLRLLAQHLFVLAGRPVPVTLPDGLTMAARPFRSGSTALGTSTKNGPGTRRGHGTKHDRDTRGAGGLHHGAVEGEGQLLDPHQVIGGRASA